MKKTWEGFYLLYCLVASDLSLRRWVAARLQDSAFYQRMGFFSRRVKVSNMMLLKNSKILP